MNIMKCPNCGRHVKANAKFCLHCGYPLQKGSNATISKASASKHHLSKRIIVGVVSVIIIILIICSVILGKHYFTPARTFSRQLPKSTWIESYRVKANHKKGKKSKKHSKKSRKSRKSSKNKKSRKPHYSYIISNGSQLLSFGKNKKSTRIFNILSGNSERGKQLRSNLSKNLKNTIIKDNYSYDVKGNNFYFKNGVSYRDIKKTKNGFTFKCYRKHKLLHTITVKVYKPLENSIK